MHANARWFLSAALTFSLFSACGRAAPGATAEADEPAPDAGPEPEPDAGPEPEPDAEPLPEIDGGDGCDPATAVCRVTLTTEVGAAGGIELESGELADMPTDGSAPVGLASQMDLSVRLGRFLGLSGVGRDSLCALGGGFATMDAIPTDEGGCVWSGNALFGVFNIPFEDPDGPGQGLLVRDRFGEKLYTLLVVDDGADYEDIGGYTGWVTFDYALVPR